MLINDYFGMTDFDKQVSRRKKYLQRLSDHAKTFDRDDFPEIDEMSEMENKKV